MTSSTTIRIDPKVKSEAAHLAEQLGLSLNTVVNAYLKKFITEKRIEFSLSDTTAEYYDSPEFIDFGPEGVDANQAHQFLSTVQHK